MPEFYSSVLFTFGSQAFRFDLVYSLVTCVHCSHWFVQCIIMLVPPIVWCRLIRYNRAFFGDCPTAGGGAKFSPTAKIWLRPPL